MCTLSIKLRISMNKQPIIINSENATIRKIAESYNVANFITAEQSENVSLAIGTATNHDETTKTSSERIYFVLEGELIINDTSVFPWSAGYIPANTEYHFQGTFKAIIINSPAFKKESESISYLDNENEWTQQ